LPVQQVPGALERGKKAMVRIESVVASMDDLTKIQYRVTLENKPGGKVHDRPH
jgi:hypothetical protein